MNRPIVLIGPMGVGKTTIGKKLSRATGLDFLDTDKEIVREHGPIAKIFSVQGEDHFRNLESQVLIQCIAKAGVVATGGGVVLREENQRALRDCFVVYLSTNGRHIGARLLSTKRPLLKNGVSDWRRIYEERKPLYEKVADFEVATNDKSLAEIVSQIVARSNA